MVRSLYLTLSAATSAGRSNAAGALTPDEEASSGAEGERGVAVVEPEGNEPDVVAAGAGVDRAAGAGVGGAEADAGAGVLGTTGSFSFACVLEPADGSDTPTDDVEEMAPTAVAVAVAVAVAAPP